MKKELHQLNAHVATLVEGQVRTDERLDRVDERFDRVDERFERVDERFERVDERFDRVDERFDRLETQFARVSVLIGETAQRTTAALAEVRDQLRRNNERLDAHTEMVMRGFTDSAARDRRLEERVDSLEQRVTDLEQQ